MDRSVLPFAALLVIGLAGCQDAPTSPVVDPIGPQLDVVNSGNPQAAFLIRDEDRCGVFLQPAVGDASNFDGKYYVTQTSAGTLNLNCTGATLREDQIPEKTYNFVWEFSGWTCHNRITTAGIAHSNCHASAAGSRGGPLSANVTGGGKDLYPGGTGATFAISFNARADRAGKIRGNVDWRFLDDTPASYGSVYCLEVRGNRFYMSYLSEGGAFGGYGVPGNTVLIGFEDNGQGANAPSDRQTFIYYAGTANYPCAAFADFIEAGGPGGGFPVEWVEGNVSLK